MRKVAIVDIGSNSIKLLVAGRDDSGRVAAVETKTLDARISAGISRAEPRLGDDGMSRGLAAIHELLAAAALHSPERAVMVATSAVRDASNGRDFTDRIQRETGCEVRILTGDEEANAIGLGLTCDPALADLRNFYVFDLGGGSLECLAFDQRRVVQAVSLQLGCVRLTEQFVPDAAAPFSAESRAQITAHVRATLTAGGFNFNLAFATSIVTGGTAVAVRAIQAEKRGKTVEEFSSLITLRQMQDLLDHVAALPLAQRQLIPGLPSARADVFPAALATLIAVAEAGGITSFRHSFYNLRYGLARLALRDLNA